MIPVGDHAVTVNGLPHVAFQFFGGIAHEVSRLRCFAVASRCQVSERSFDCPFQFSMFNLQFSMSLLDRQPATRKPPCALRPLAAAFYRGAAPL
jgi:hypothetical protein